MSGRQQERMAVLWTIVIVFISQLFHCAYTSGGGGGGGKQFAGVNLQYAPPHYTNNHYKQQVVVEPRETYEELLSSGSGQQPFESSGSQPESLSNTNTNNNNNNQRQELNQQQLASRERCRELISLTLLSFRDLSPDGRASEEIDCANLRAHIAAATNRAHHRSSSQSHQPQPVVFEDQPESGTSQLPADDFPLAPVYSSPASSSRARQQQQQQFARALHPFTPADNFSSASSWLPKSIQVNQMQLLLAQQQQQRRQLLAQQQQDDRLQFYKQQEEASTTLAPTTTQATTFESLFETTLAPITTTSTTTPATTTTTTTTTTSAPRIRAGGKRRLNGGARPAHRSSTTTTTTTSTTTTTARPSTPNDYADGSELSTDYYDEYEDQQQQTTTTTTTTQRPPQGRHRGGGGGHRKGRRMRPTSSTTSKPSTTSTTLSPGYQPRPDGRIIDYMADPNFPRELKGADLTNYPFYISVPEKIDFECKGRHDGYYTNIDLHCQIYHHCAVGNRYDFLCPNYTLFDQTTFTCRFINTVDCVGSAKHFDRNNALYVEKNDNNNADKAATSSTTTTTTTTSTTTSTQAPRINIQLSQRNQNLQRSSSAPISALTLVKQRATGGTTSDNSSNR